VAAYIIVILLILLEANLLPLIAGSIKVNTANELSPLAVGAGD
jgi:hypothetical protein